MEVVYISFLILSCFPFGFSDVSNNNLCGTIPVDGPFASFPMERYLDPVNLLSACSFLESL